MTAVVETDLVEKLMAQADWLRALSRSLVGEDLADDLVQDTFEAALSHPPSTDRPLRPWLGRVLRNRAKMSWRSQRRRRLREDAAAPLPYRDAIADKLRLHNELVTAVIDLDAPYREVIVLRFVEGWSAADIARERGVPAATIRSQLKRGLERLRARLDGDHGRQAWTAALMPAFQSPTTPAVGLTPTATGIIVKTALPIAAATSIAIAAAVVAFASGPDDGPVEPESAGSAAARVTAPAPTSVSPVETPPAPGKGLELRRFQNADARDAFARALSTARRKRQHVDKKAYDFGSVNVPPAHPTPTVARAEAGSLDKNYIKDRMSEVIPLIRECYEIALEGDGVTDGSLVLEFVIDAEEEIGGYVREASVGDDSTIQSPDMRECVTETIYSLEFIPPKGGGEVFVRYPFTFATE